MGSGKGYPPEWGRVNLETKVAAGFRCVRCGHPGARWSPPGNDHERVAGVLEHKLEQAAPGDVRCEVKIIHIGGGGAWLRHHRIPCDALCTHDPEIRDHRVLTVHHLDGDKGNLRWWNLACLDQRCHLEIQGRVKVRQTWPFEHSRWFWPYIGGFYAFEVLGLDLSRAEVEADIVRFLAAGQPHLEDQYRIRFNIENSTL